MFLGKVVGNIVSTSKNEGLVGKKIFIVQPLSPSGEPVGLPVVSIDAVGSGIGERVLVTTGSAARAVFAENPSVIDSAIVAIIDSIELEMEGEQR